MAFALPNFSKSEIDKAGKILAVSSNDKDEESVWANQVLANWRACHLYPINTFQATLRNRLAKFGMDALVAQRLKRSPSIVAKLQRFTAMKLSKMQDIGGLRAVLQTVEEVRQLEAYYKTSTNFQHELKSFKDYLADPKSDGYRGVHLIYRYQNKANPIYNGLSIEPQLRTKLEHAWATAVETMGIYLNQALKSGQGETDWRNFFAVASAAIALQEKTSPIPGYNNLSDGEVYKKLAIVEKRLKVLEKLEKFAVITDRISTTRGAGVYHLIILDSNKRSTMIIPFTKANLDKANSEYSRYEEKARRGEPIEAVLVSAGPVDALKKAYPNYFLDTQAFINEISRIIKIA